MALNKFILFNVRKGKGHHIYKCPRSPGRVNWSLVTLLVWSIKRDNLYRYKSSRYKSMFKLVEADLCLLVSNTAAEKVFSVINELIKDFIINVYSQNNYFCKSKFRLCMHCRAWISGRDSRPKFRNLGEKNRKGRTFPPYKILSFSEIFDFMKQYPLL